MQIIYIISKYF